MKTAPLLAAALLAASTAAAQCPSRPLWPTAGWSSRAAQVAAARAPEIAALEQYLFTLTGADAERKGIRTDGIVIIQGGELAYERYARGFDASRRHLSWSVSKSFGNALAGIAVQKGALSLSDSVCSHLQGLPPASCAIRVQDLLEFASGLDWRESYEGQSNQASSVLAMLYGEGRSDMARFVAAHPFRDPPGTSWEYSSGDANLLGAVLDAALGPANGGPSYPWTLLFDPLGISSAVWERDGSGTLIASSYLYASPRDLAKFGFLFLNDGCWEGRRILPAGWVADSTAVTAPFLSRRIDRGPEDVGGRMWWLNRAVPELSFPPPWPDVPADAYAALGHWGQSITVVPSLDMVVVRVGDDREPALDFDRFLSLAIAVGRP